MRRDHRLAPDGIGNHPAGDVGVVRAVDGDVGHRVGEATAGIADPDGRRHLGGVASEPDRGVLVGAARLARSRPIRERGRAAGAALEGSIDDIGEHAGHGIGHAARDHLAASGIGHGEVVAVAVGDLQYDARLAVGAVVREGGVGARHRQRRDLHRAEGEGRHPQQRIAGRQADAHLLGDLRLPAEPEALGEGDEVGVRRERRRLEHVEEAGRTGVAHRDRLELRAVCAVDEVFEGLGVGRVDALRGREALLESGGQGEHLEGRSGLHADGAAESLVDVVVVRRLAPALESPFAVLRHGDDVARAGLDEGDGRCALARVLDRDVRRHGLHGGVLHVGIERRANGEATAAQQCLALDERLAERRVGLDHADDEVAEVGSVGGRAAIGLDGGIEDLLDGDARRGAGLDGRDEAGLRHLAEDQIASLLRQLRVARGIEGRGLLDDAGQGGALHEVELGRRLGEVAAGRSLDAVGAGAEVHDVEVALEDLFLRVAPLERERVADLAKLARRRARASSLELFLVGRARDEEVLDVLLRDGRSALGAA